MRYTIHNTEVGIVVAEYEADSPRDRHDVDPGYAGPNFVTKDQDGNVVDTGAPVRTWPSCEFKRRFTREERIAIRDAAKTDAVIADFMNILDSAPEVVSNDQDIVSALEHIETAGLLAAGRVAVILERN